MFRKQGLLFLLLSVSVLFVRAQSAFDRRWAVVDSLLTKKGLTASALAEVNSIYAQARREKNEPQAIKALVYRLRLEQLRSDEGLPAAIRELQGQVDSTRSEPMRSILENMLAGLYEFYLQGNRYRIAERESLSRQGDTDITTWSVAELTGKIRELYLNSLKAKNLLASINVAAYAPIIHPGNMPALRPTLFDLLAHRALDYFKAGELYEIKPVQTFTLDDPALFGDALAFAGHNFFSVDSASGYYHAIRLFQRLVQLHLNDAQPEALISLEIERYSFIYANTTNEALYLQALGRLTDKYPISPAAAEAWYLQAERHYLHAIAKDIDTPDSTGAVKAKAICERVLAEPDSGEGKANCVSLLQQILHKDVRLEVEGVNIPYKPFRLLVTWQNFDRLYGRLIRLNDESVVAEKRGLYHDSSYLRRLLVRPVFRSFDVILPVTRDYLSHSVETAIGPLPPGTYVLVVNSDSGWSRSQGVIGFQYISVSAIAYIRQDKDFFVVNRESGKPISGAVALVSDEDRGYRRHSSEPKKQWTYISDKDGHFIVRLDPEGDNNLQLREISIEGDHFWPEENQYYGSQQVDAAGSDARTYESRHARCYLFTDRSIYRPGQTLFFKGILTTQDAATHQPKVMAGFTTKVLLYNANRQTVDSLTVTSNDFGSYHGSMRLPDNQLNGQFRLYDSVGGTCYFSVEEYKRPRFYVEYENQTTTYRVGDSIRVTGMAKSYAGNGIDGAKVSYRVVRRTHFPYSWMFWRTAMPSQQQQEIVSGSLTTDAAGKFSFVFYASPDQHTAATYQPEFNYTVNADVTDLNGETRSAETSIVAGYTGVRLSLAVGDRMPADSLRSVRVIATNLSGTPVDAAVRVAIYPLRAPQRLIRKRLWDAPDRFIYSESAWLDSFPHDEYRAELEKETWPRGAVVWDTTRRTAGSGSRKGELAAAGFAIPSGLLAPGWYVIEARTTDKSGVEVKDLHYVELYDSKTGRPANPQYSWASDERLTVEPGGKAVVTTGSSGREAYVIRTLAREKFDGRDVGYSHFLLNGESKKTEWVIAESDRGGFQVLDAFVRDNRLYTQSTIVDVPWTNKELHIQYASFRDKTEPGSAEKWQMTISGSRGDKVSAEVLTAMYDASLDQFQPHGWSAPYIYRSFNGAVDWNSDANFNSVGSELTSFDRERRFPFSRTFDVLMEPIELSGRIAIRGYASMRMASGFFAEADTITNSGDMYVHGRVMSKYNDADLEQDKIEFTKFTEPKVIAESKPPDVPVQARKDFRETAFFFPDLQTDSAGSVKLSFTMPEALTTWKWMTLASTRDLAFGYDERSVITQKKLMVQPNAPRFLREGDKMELQVKVVNMTDSELTGQMSLVLTDPTTGETADGWFVNRQANQYFTVEARQSVVVGFPLDIPYQYNRPLTYRVVAQAGAYSDGEEATLPVVSNRMLVTESLPLNLPGDGTQHYSFEKLLQSGSSETLNHHALTVEFTANPAWYAIQSLSYLAEYPYACAEQTFERAYANALASKIVNSAPRLQQVFDAWRVSDTAMFLSNLQKNQELKSVLLEETPWILQGKSEAEQRAAIASLFDMKRMSGALESALNQLQDMQGPSGAFPWFKGGDDNRYITQYIVTGLGKLEKLQAIPPTARGKVTTIVAAALSYLDGELKKDYTYDKREEARRPAVGVALSALQAQYLYMRTFFSEGMPGGVFPAVNYFRKKAQQGWVERSNELKGMIALALYRTGDVQTAKDILKSLQQNAIHDPEKGMYWKGMEGGYYWYQAPVETQALLIEAFHEISGDAGIDRELKTWLLRQKQTHSWATTTATANACYALLLGTPDWITAERTVEIDLGDKKIDWPGAGVSGNSGTSAASGVGVGYFKKVFDGPFVNPSMGNITVTMRTKGGGSPAWGSVYWQYFDMLDHITPPGGGKTVLSVVKKLYVKRNTDRGPVLDTLADNATLHAGDRVVVRMILRADRDLEFVHVKDMRAACFEPENVLSGYKWQDGVGYYETTKDVSTDLFFDRFPRGTRVIEYTLLAGQSGNFSNGVTTIECMYAPEFSYHSEGIRVNVEP